MSAKRLISRIYKEHLKFTKKKTMEKENGQKNWTDPSGKRISKWPINNEKVLKLLQGSPY